MAWLRVASHLHAPSVSELKGRLTYSEFLDWLAYIEWDESRHKKEHYYLASIAAEVRRSISADPKKVQVKDFLIELVDAAKKAKVEQSKQIWLSAVGLKRN